MSVERERIRARERWQRAVTEIDNAVLSGADAGEVLELAASRLRRLAEAEWAKVPALAKDLVGGGALFPAIKAVPK